MIDAINDLFIATVTAVATFIASYLIVSLFVDEEK